MKPIDHSYRVLYSEPGPYMIRTVQPVTRRGLAARVTGADGFYIDGTSEVEDIANAGG